MTADMISLARARRIRDSAGVVEPEVQRWKCRETWCVTRVGVTQTAIDALAMFNTELARRRERPIREDEVMRCEMHREGAHE